MHSRPSCPGGLGTRAASQPRSVCPTRHPLTVIARAVAVCTRGDWTIRRANISARIATLTAAALRLTVALRWRLIIRLWRHIVDRRIVGGSVVIRSRGDCTQTEPERHAGPPKSASEATYDKI